MEIKRQGFAFELKAASDAGVIEGYGSIFANVDRGGDVVAKGAFAQTIAEHKADGTMPAMLWQHDARQPLGVWEEMAEDNVGLYMKGRINLEKQIGREMLSDMKMGSIKGLSIGYGTREYSYDREKEIRTLLNVKLWEVSPVTFPMNPLAGITSAKTAADILTIRDFENSLRDVLGFSKADAKAIASLGWQGLKRRDADSDDAESETVALLRSIHKSLITGIPQ